MKIAIRIVAAALALLVAALPAFAQEYPVRPVRIIVPFGPGSGIDLAARLLAERLTKSMGQTFVVENRAGATGTIGSAAVAAAAPDGYTLLANGPSHTIVDALMKNLPYDGSADLAPVAMIAESSLVLVAPKSKGYRSVKDLVAAAKSRPGQITFATAGVGSNTHISSEKFRIAAGFTALHVPYKSTTDAIAEVMAGRIDFLLTATASALGPVRDGRLVALAMGQKRSSALPNVPTLAEAGIANADTRLWFGLFAPAKTPRDIIVKLNRESMKAMSTPDSAERLAALGSESSTTTLEEFEAIVKREFVENAALIKAAGIKLD